MEFIDIWWEEVDLNCLKPCQERIYACANDKFIFEAESITCYREKERRSSFCSAFTPTETNSINRRLGPEAWG